MGENCCAHGYSSAEKCSQPYPVMNAHVTVVFYGVGKNWASPFFPHPDKVEHQPCSEGYRGAGVETAVHMVNRLRKNTANLTLS